jgi:predicted nucleic acid-binding protein
MQVLIIAFARIGQMDLLRRVVGEIVLPSAVYEELVARGVGRAEAREVTEEPWIYRESVSERSSLQRSPPVLSPGQRESIVLARELGLPLLIDERAGRAEVLRLGLDVRGSLRVLAEAKRQGLIPLVRPLVEAIVASGYWLRGDLVATFLEATGE